MKEKSSTEKKDIEPTEVEKKDIESTDATTEKNNDPTETITHRFKNQEVWQEALNLAPNDKWIKQRSLGGGRTASYLPIERQQALADVFFKEFDIHDAKFTTIVNEVLCTVYITVLADYPNAEYRIISGSASKPIQCAKGSKPCDFPIGKLTNSLEYCAPAARAVAIGNALETFANVFGRNLGRKTIGNGYSINKKK